MAVRTIQQQIDDIDAMLKTIETDGQEIDSDEVKVRFPNYSDLVKERKRLVTKQNKKRYSTINMSNIA